MFTTPWSAALISIFAWWFFTGVILFIVRRSDAGDTVAHSRSVFLTIPFAALGVAGLVVSVGSLTILNVYISFISVLLVWGWIELAFLAGVITGPERRPCPPELDGWPRFYRAFDTLSYHEFLLFVTFLGILTLSANAENTFGFWTFLILFGARISAKLNLFFGVPRINTEFVPVPIQHLKSYFRKGPITFAFPIGVTLLSLAAGCFAERLISTDTLVETIGFSLLTAMAALAALEHWLMVIPLPDAKLWRWMLPEPTTTKGKSHEL